MSTFLEYIKNIFEEKVCPNSNVTNTLYINRDAVYKCHVITEFIVNIYISNNSITKHLISKLTENTVFLNISSSNFIDYISFPKKLKYLILRNNMNSQKICDLPDSIEYLVLDNDLHVTHPSSLICLVITSNYSGPLWYLSKTLKYLIFEDNNETLKRNSINHNMKNIAFINKYIFDKPILNMYVHIFNKTKNFNNLPFNLNNLKIASQFFYENKIKKMPYGTTVNWHSPYMLMNYSG